MADEKQRDLDFDSNPKRSPSPPNTMSSAAISGNPILPVLAYCGSSILMTVTNKYVLSGSGFNLNFFLLCVQVRRAHCPWPQHKSLTLPRPVRRVHCRHPDPEDHKGHLLSRLQD